MNENKMIDEIIEYYNIALKTLDSKNLEGKSKHFQQGKITACFDILNIIKQYHVVNIL